jgi:hypothetical protein
MRLSSIFSSESLRAFRLRVDPILAVAVVLAVLLEAGLRLEIPDRLGIVLPDGVRTLEKNGYYPPPHVFDPAHGYGYEPGYTGTMIRTDYSNRLLMNSHGFHDRPWPEKKPPGVCRIVLLGDSLLASNQVQVQEMWSSVVASHLRPVGGRAVELLNCGLDGYIPWNFAGLLEDEILRFEPDAVILYGSFHYMKASDKENYRAVTRADRILACPDPEILHGTVEIENSESISLRCWTIENIFIARLLNSLMNKKVVAKKQFQQLAGESPLHPFPSVLERMRDTCARAGVAFGVYYREVPPPANRDPARALGIQTAVEFKTLRSYKGLLWKNDFHFSAQGSKIYGRTVFPLWQDLIERLLASRK